MKWNNLRRGQTNLNSNWEWIIGFEIKHGMIHRENIKNGVDLRSTKLTVTYISCVLDDNDDNDDNDNNEYMTTIHDDGEVNDIDDDDNDNDDVRWWWRFVLMIIVVFKICGLMSEQRWILMSELRWISMVEQRYLMSEQRWILMSEQRYLMSEQRYLMLEQRYLMSEQRSAHIIYVWPHLLSSPTL